MYLPTDIIMLPHFEKAGNANIPIPNKPWHFHSDYVQKPLTDISEDKESFCMNLKQLLYYDNGMWRMFNVTVSEEGAVVRCSSRLTMPNDANPEDILSAKEVTRAEFDEMGFSVVNDKSYIEMFDTTPEIIEWLRKRLVLASVSDQESFDKAIEPWKNATTMVNMRPKDKIEEEINREAISNLGTITSKYIGKITSSGPLHSREKMFRDHREINVNRDSLPDDLSILVPNLDYVEPKTSSLPGCTWVAKGGWLYKMAFIGDSHVFLHYTPEKGFLSYNITEDWKYYYIDQDTKVFLLKYLIDSGYIKVRSDGDMDRIKSALSDETAILRQSSEAFIRPVYGQVINNSSIKRW